MIDPSTAKVADVQDYLDEHPEELEAVQAAEAEGQARKGILEYVPTSAEVADLPEGATLVDPDSPPSGRWYRLMRDGEPVRVDGKEVRIPHNTNRRNR